MVAVWPEELGVASLRPMLERGGPIFFEREMSVRPVPFPMTCSSSSSLATGAFAHIFQRCPLPRSGPARDRALSDSPSSTAD